MALGVRLLGPVELSIDGLVVPIERLQVRRLLALLALGGGAALSHEDLIEQLWPGELPKEPRAALRVVLSRLRAALGRESGRLTSTGVGVALAVDELDLSRSARLARDAELAATAPEELVALDAAVSMWRGRPFAGAHGPPRLDAVGDALDGQRWALRTRRAEVLLALGRHVAAADEAGALVEADPLDERRSCVLALALSREGRRVEALRVLARLRRRLRTESGLTPGEASLAVEREILEVDAAMSPIELKSGAPAMRLYGRDQQTTDLVAALEAGPGRRGVAVLVGPAGIGKTSLAERAAEVLGLRVTRLALIEVRPEGDGHALVGPAAAALAGPRGSAIVERAVHALQRRARASGVLLLDDVHHASPTELRVVRDALSADHDRARRVIITCREPDGPDGGAELRSFVDELAAAGVPVHRLMGLERHQTRRMVVDLAGRSVSPSAAEQLQRATEGNPYLLRCLIDARIDPEQLGSVPLPEVLHHLVAARVEGLPPEDLELAVIAASLGERLDVSLIAVVAGRPVEDVARWADRGLRSGLLRTDGVSISFDHELTRVALADRTGGASRQHLHRRAAQACRELGRGDLITARHTLWADGGDDPASQATLLRGAEASLNLGEYGTARRLFEQAARFEDDGARKLEIQLRLAWSTECEGQREHADDLYEQIFAAARLRGMRDIGARAALGGRAFGGVVGGSGSRRRRLLDALDDPPADQRLHLEVLSAATGELRAADQPVPAALLETTRTWSSDDDAEATLLLLVELSDIASRPFDDSTTERVVTLAHLAGRVGEPAVVLRAAELLVAARLARGELPAAVDASARFDATATASRWPRYVWTARLYEALLRDLTDGPEAAEPLARRAMVVGREMGIADAANAYALFRLSVAWRQDDLGPLAPFVEQAVTASPTLAAWRAIHAACLAPTDAPGALRQLESFDELRRSSTLFAPIGWAFAARAARTLGHAQVAASASAALERWSGQLLVAGAGAACFGPADWARAEALSMIETDLAERCRAAGAELVRAAAPGGSWSPG